MYPSDPQVPDFTLNRHLDHLYASAPRPLQFAARDAASLRKWQQQTRDRVRALLGIDGLPDPVLAEHVQVAEHRYDAYTEEKHALTTAEGIAIPLYLLVPHAAGPYRTVLVFHGHNPSVQYILGHYPDAAVRDEHLGRDANYAQRLAEAGYLVCAVEQRSFGERLSLHDRDRTQPNSCRHQSFFYQMMGRTMVGERCRDGIVALDFMLARSDVARGRIGITGNSGGGTIALWLGALEERLAVVVPGSYFCSFRDSIMDIHHCECNYVPGAAAALEMGDLAALIAPRPLRFVQGAHDPIFPIQAARREYGTAAAAYALLEVPERLDLAVFPTGHAYNVPAAAAWFGQWL